MTKELQELVERARKIEMTPIRLRLSVRALRMGIPISRMIALRAKWSPKLTRKSAISDRDRGSSQSRGRCPTT